jgi:hypothetical protein
MVRDETTEDEKNLGTEIFLPVDMGPNGRPLYLSPPISVMPFITGMFGVPDPASTHPDRPNKRHGFTEFNHRNRRRWHHYPPSHDTATLQQEC